jgi:hypothetical protein
VSFFRFFIFALHFGIDLGFRFHLLCQRQRMVGSDLRDPEFVPRSFHPPIPRGSQRQGQTRGFQTFEVQLQILQGDLQEPL